MDLIIFVALTDERYVRAQSRLFNGGLEERSISSNAQERASLPGKEPSLIQKGVLHSPATPSNQIK